jgi:tetratricopeptide (TPR) repeat protein
MRILRLIAFVTVLHVVGLHAQVRVWQGTLTLPTYEEGLPDPNPPFDQFTTNRFNYPYTLRNNLTSRRTDHAWRAIYLENEYLKCSVLPDIGGHLYTCTDKISGKPMFYANPSIKKAAIAYRGAWAAFGIEFNFPVSHNWMTMSPVNFALAEHEDGSASATVGNVDRVYGMEWSVELILRPKSTVLEQRVTLSNRSDVRHRFYWWNNAGVEAWDDSKIEYPMRFAATHGFTEVHPWPVDDDGVDYSILGNHKNGPVSMFTHGSREDFMGVWNPHTNTGTVHYAPYADLPAKKIWSWGVDADGLDWRKALSDNNSGYLEVQAGLFRNQETYAFLQPRQVIRFSEYWMPVREIDGISRANLAGVASLKRKGNSLVAGFNANYSITQATVSILNGKQQAFVEKTSLAPERTWKHEIPNADSAAKYTIEVKDAKGATVLRQTEGEYDWTPVSEIHVGPQTAYRIPDPKQRSYDDWLQFGKDEELNGRLLNALETYKQALAKYPNGYAAQKAAGRLAAGSLRFEEARGYLEPLRSRDTTDGELAYYLGLVYVGLGDDDHARTVFEDAERLPSFRSAAALQLGELSARAGDTEIALRHLKEAAQGAPLDQRTQEELAALKSATNAGDARAEAQRLTSRFPLSYLLKEEVGKPDLVQLANDTNRVLNVASQYMRLGLYRKALGILSRKYPEPVSDQTELGSLSPQKHPMVAYFRGYCLDKLGESGANDYHAASQLSAAYVFPSTATEYAVLRSAVKANTSDPVAHYLLGTFYFSRGLTDPALTEWAEAKKYGPNLPVLSASTGLALLHIKNDPVTALAAFQDGMRSDPENIAVYLGMDQALSLLNRSATERADALSRYPHLDTAPPPLIYELILNLAEAGNFEKATSLFHNRFFPREEGGTNVRQVWIEVQLQKAVALTQEGKCDDALLTATNLGSEVPGLVFTRDGLAPIIQSARTSYLLAEVYNTCGKADMAQSKLKAAVNANSPDQLRWSWLAAQKLPGFNQQQWQQRLAAAFDQAASRSETSQYPSWWMYSAGLLARELGRNEEANTRFHKALLLPDRMLAYHFTRLAHAETPQKSPQGE